ncbi:5059_t:CDS:2 [Funneliformis geosporum]|uniref:tRNA(Phe) 7-[(3-amino-3-carboxypropyl)-4-demethylwyosine(37)-N(4)]-methyltransferase n=1 Tax=Funneliformis geosporum TaxID=1117311 RepID=A0A9W4SBF3_9GLOM|nr:5059_t:CDS:2 [Funneliformis geosporum]CAI2162713.1 3575_t:CDS:2 [Funneliformis geosporum]
MTSHNFQSMATKRLPAHHSTHPGFHTRKQQILSSLTSTDPSSRIDKSPKGSIDEAILPLIELLNRHDDYVTTSSCSGRVAIYCAGKGIKKHTNKFYASNNQIHDDIDEIDTNVKDEELEVNDVDDLRYSTKGGGKWLYVTHSHVELPKENNKEKLNEFLLKTIFGVEHVNVISLNDHDNDYNKLLKDDDNRMIYFKFEPMVKARTLDAAKNLVISAIDTGYRESGLLTTTKRHMVVIRSSLKLDAPIARLDPTDHKLYLFVDLSYLYLLTTLSNRKFDENSRKINELYKTIEDHLFAGIGSGEDVIKRCTKETGKTWEHKEERRERKRREGLARQFGLRKSGTMSDGNDGDVSTVDDESQGLDNA